MLGSLCSEPKAGDSRRPSDSINPNPPEAGRHRPNAAGQASQPAELRGSGPVSAGLRPALETQAQFEGRWLNLLNI